VNVRYRMDGHLKKIVDFPKRLLDRVISRIKILAKLDIAEKENSRMGASACDVWTED